MLARMPKNVMIKLIPMGSFGGPLSIALCDARGVPLSTSAHVGSIDSLRDFLAPAQLQADFFQDAWMACDEGVTINVELSAEIVAKLRGV